MRRLTIPFLLLLTIACGSETAQTSPRGASASAPVGDPAIGKERIDRYACLACHRIPGFDGPQGSLGPSLEGMASRPTISGRVPNNAETMIAFLQNPQAVDPQNRMTAVGVTEEDARHLAAFLATLD